MTWPDLKPTEVHYPESDGQPMAESDLHRDVMFDLITAARDYCQGDREAYVTGNLFVYFEEGHPKSSVAPDFLVVRAVGSQKRGSYKVWEEGKAPELTIEVTSPKSHIKDLGDKRAIYERLGVLEYYVFDPEGVRFQPPFRGFRLVDGNLVPVEPAEKPDGTLVFKSDVLDLEIHARGETLRFVDPRTGDPLPVSDELREKIRAEIERAEEAEERAENERKRAEAAEAELARLRKELGRDN